MEEKKTERVYWTRPSERLKVTRDQILSLSQYAKSYLEKTKGYYDSNSDQVSSFEKRNSQNCTESTHREDLRNSKHEFTVVFSGKNDPQCTQMQKFFNQSGVVNNALCSTNHPHGFSASLGTNVSQQSVPHAAVNNDNLGVLSKNCTVQHWHLHMYTTNLPKDSIQQQMSTGHRNFGPHLQVRPTPASVSYCTEPFNQTTGTFKSNLELPFESPVNIQSRAEYVNGTRELVSLTGREQCFVGTSEGISTKNVFVEYQRGHPDNSAVVSAKCKSIEHLTGHISQSKCEQLQQVVCLPKESYQKCNIPHKAIAVVAPLAQQPEQCLTFPKDLNKINEKSVEERSLSIRQDHQPFIPQSQSRANEHFSVLDMSGKDSRLFQNPKPEVEANKYSSHGERCSVTLSSVNGEKRESMQSVNIDKSKVKCFYEDNGTVSSQSSEKTETRMELESSDKWSTIPVTEWSLQRLRSLVIYLEQKKKDCDVPSSDVSNEILKLYWNGNYKKLCDAARSDHYSNIMKEVKLHRGMENSVILYEVSNEKLQQVAKDFYILSHDAVMPKTSLFSISDKLDSDKKGEYSSHFISLCSTSKSLGKVNQKHKTTHKAECEETPAAKKKLSERVPLLQAQNHILENAHEKKNGSVDDKMFMKQMKDTKNNGTNSFTPTPEPEKPTSPCITAQNCEHRNVIKESAAAKEQTEVDSGNEKTNLENPTLRNNVPSNKESLTISDDLMSVKPGNLLTSEPGIAPSLDDGDKVYTLAFGKINVLSSGEAKRLFAVVPCKEENNLINISAQTFKDEGTQSKTGSLEHKYEHKKHLNDEMVSAKTNASNHTREQVKSYCCLANWFHSLGYKSGVLCMCKKEAELSVGTAISSKGVEETTKVNSDDHRHSFSEVSKHSDSENHAEGCKVINLALFGTSRIRQNGTMTTNNCAKQRRSENRFSDEACPPPTNIQIRIRNKSLNNNTSQECKQHTYNAWKNGHVASTTLSKSRPKSLKHAKKKKNANTTFCSRDGQQKNIDQSKKKSHLTQRDKMRKKKHKKAVVTSLNHTNSHSKANKNEPTKASLKLNKGKDESHLILNFKVLPEYFQLTDSSATVEADHCWNPENKMEKCKDVEQRKRTLGNSALDAWCVSPKKKRFKSAPPRSVSGSSSTFQEFKKRYEAKKQRLSPTT